MNAIKDLILKMADDALIIGHRNSEWTGLGPTLEEDISFSSIAQDKLGHALQLYTILHEDHEEQNPDLLAFTRKAEDFRCCQYVEMPIGAYDFSLIRQFLFDHAEYNRYQMLSNSSNNRLAALSQKIKGEIKYHVLHADTWVIQLGNGTTESHDRLQKALTDSMPLALGIFEKSAFEAELIRNNIFEGEDALRERWLGSITPILQKAGLELPDISTIEPAYGGRKGQHTGHLKPLLDEMGEVLNTDPTASW